MKSLQKRIYNVLPRVAGAASSSSSPTATLPISTSTSASVPRARSNSLSSSSRPFHTAGVSPLNFFDSPPSSSRPSIPSASRLPVEVKPTEIEGPPHTPHGQSSHPPLSLALAQPQSNGGSTLVGNLNGSSGHPSLFPYSLTSAPNLHNKSLPTACPSQQHVQAKKYKAKYQLYVGAYGIPKRCTAPSTKRRPMAYRTSTEEDMGLAVQVGEDAYFIRDNAMGVADGVGGWAKTKPREIPLWLSGPTARATPSALFARRLMHYCSAEMEVASGGAPTLPLAVPPLRPPRAPSAFTYPISRSAPTPILMPHVTPWQWSDSTFPSFSAPFASSSLPSQPVATPTCQHSSLADRLELEEELEESLEELSEGMDVLQILEKAYDRTLKAHVVPAADPSLDASRATFPPPTAEQRISKPIDKPITPSSSPRVNARNSKPEVVPLMSGSSTALLAVLDHVPKHGLGQFITDAGMLPSISATNVEAEDRYDAVIKIAHVGDCMGMLVRGEQIAWRSEEMWWNFNTPVQLGPSTPTTPRTSAHVFTLPVLADDILILATDGLSDNLWDEDVLDEVVRFRRNFLGIDCVSSNGDSQDAAPVFTAAERVLRRRTLAGMLSEALCSRARRVSERRYSDVLRNPSNEELGANDDDEVPFARRAREAGKQFRGGKNDDISVIVAVISPAADLAEESASL